MKKYFFFTLLSILILSSCTPDDDPIIPPVVELAPTIELSVSPNDAVVPYSTNVTVSWTSTNAKTVTLNGETVATSGSKIINNMIATTKYTALATNITKTATVEKTVTVGDEATPTATLTISPTDAVLPYGDNVTVTWNITNFKTATLNGEAITQATGSKEVKKMLKDSTFTIVATNFTKSVTTTKTVTVGDWKSSRFGLLTHNQKHWVLNRYEYFYEGKVYFSEPLENYAVGRYFIYYNNGTAHQFDVNNNTLNDIVWVLESNDTKLHWFQIGIDYVWDIYNLTETELSFSEEMTINGYPVKFVRTWKIQE